MTLKETYSRVCVSNYLFVLFPARNGLKNVRCFITTVLWFRFKSLQEIQDDWNSTVHIRVWCMLMMVTYLTEDYMLLRKTLKLY